MKNGLAYAAACLVGGLCVIGSHGTADAQFPAVTDRNFAIDLYQGSVLGSGSIVGMGGAAVATAIGSSGMLANPAAPAVRPANSVDKWAWDWHVDWASPAIGSDFDNNGIDSDEAFTAFITLGGVINYENWAFGLSFDSFEQPADDANPTFMIARASLARSFRDNAFTVGVGLRFGTFDMKDGGDKSLFTIGGGALEAGGVWHPQHRDFRVGATVSLPVTGTEPSVQACDPLDCSGFILPNAVEVPWRIATGVAWRRADTRWNKELKTRWRDERYLLLAADLVTTGAVDNGYGIEAFVVNKQLQPSGRKTVLSFRGGAEYEWLPGRLRVRGGTYWEPGRFRDPMGDTIKGRLHATIGADYRFWNFRLWGEYYRVRASLTGDGADGYGNGGLSVGFWH